MNILASRSNDVRQVKRARDAARKADLQASEGPLVMETAMARHDPRTL